MSRRMKYPSQETRDKELRLLIEVIDGPHLRHRRIAIDGGANIGDWSAIMSRTFKRVIAFEPTPGTLDDLADRLRAEDIKNVDIRGEALLHTQTTVEMQVREKTKCTSAFAKLTGAGETPAMPLDDLGLHEVDLIKLDLEGAEYLALQGAEWTISASKPILIIEEIPNQLARFNSTTKDIAEFVKRFGYREVAYSYPNRVYGAP